MEGKTTTSVSHKTHGKWLALSIGLLILSVIGAIWLTQSPLVKQKFGAGEERLVSADNRGAYHNSPRILNNPVGDGIQPLRPCSDEPEESVLLSWDFINGLFVVILVLGFVVFPVLFWIWFGPIHKK